MRRSRNTRLLASSVTARAARMARIPASSDTLGTRGTSQYSIARLSGPTRTSFRNHSNTSNTNCSSSARSALGNADTCSLNRDQARSRARDVHEKVKHKGALNASKSRLLTMF